MQKTTAKYVPDVPDAPRWAVRAAHAVPFAVMPAGVWRILLAFGRAGVGHGPQSRFGAGQFSYVLCLSVLSEGLALLTLGLVKPWGERVPSWIPLLGGRNVPVRAAVVPAAVGAALLGLIAAYVFLDPIVFHFHFSGIRPQVVDMHAADATDVPHLEVRGLAKAFFVVCYAPLLAWPVLLGAVTYAYNRRRRRAVAELAVPDEDGSEAAG